ncbi:DUF2163 domain-containing protein [Methylobacterium ajmalii]|jgi:uncharacterized phage protein (TIGR02218 family)|uniref:DUF2163 domain-containing protein n=2 Tax=Methylobacterium TaxID=407 RepID=UPI00190AFF8A|nr:DUF2163 domain-containing protein [Methylobacterium ajmalii]MBK3396416.1 DUF2163 domain-containing protein [Methylobacterium ajmalii]MBK3423987.1 DUF2163 domain-containing protein [Methylobacterium ajmalii]
MKILSPSLAASLASGVTTLCQCWIVTRTDGLRLGFTDHDEDLVVDGVTCSAESGATGTAVEQGTGLSADNLEIVGALTSGRLAESELARGLFDGAAVAVWRVDWASPDDRVLILSGTVGEVSRGPTAFTAEVRGLADRLNQPRGRVYQRSCDALLGDARCGVDAGAAAIRGAGTVATVRSARSVTASGLAAYVSRWFEAGRLVWTSGANAGAAVEVRAHGLAGGLASLDLWEPMPAPISPGDTFQVVAGCDKSLASCRDKFANVLNFRGFPDLPGNDYAVAYAVQGADNDGGRLG